MKPADCPIQVVKETEKNTYLINRTPKHGSGVDFRGRRKLKNGLFIFTAYNRDQCIEYAKRLLEKYGYDPEILQIEY